MEAEEEEGPQEDEGDAVGHKAWEIGGDMTINEMIKVIQAYKDGKKIESRRICLGMKDPWSEAICPCWDFVDFEYRVKPEPKCRPYNDVNEMIADFKERFKPNDCPSYSMPSIWVMWNGRRSYIDGFDEKAVCVRGFIHDMDELFISCTYLDGSPCGKEVSDGQEI